MAVHDLRGHFCLPYSSARQSLRFDKSKGVLTDLYVANQWAYTRVKKIGKHFFAKQKGLPS